MNLALHTGSLLLSLATNWVKCSRSSRTSASDPFRLVELPPPPLLAISWSLDTHSKSINTGTIQGFWYIVRYNTPRSQKKTAKNSLRFTDYNKMASVATLNNGNKMPLVGLGCWKIPNETCAQQIYDAISVGYRVFDGAEDYGNEKEVGEGIRNAIKDGLVKREELCVVSKLWNSYHHPKNVKLALKRTLSDMGLDYLDLFYIHFPIALKPVSFEEKYPPGLYTGEADAKAGVLSEEPVPILDTYRALEECVEEGLIKSIGVSNFSGSLMLDLLRGARIPPAALQIELHPYLTQERYVKWVQSKGVQVVAYSSFGPQSFVDIGSEVAKATPPLFEHAVVKKIADKHGVSTSQVLLRWATQQKIAVIPKSSKKERLRQNLLVDQEVTLTESEIKEISGLNKNLRFNDPFTWSEKTPFPIFD